MGKKSKDRAGAELSRPDGAEPSAPMKNKEYRRLLKPLHAELVALQEWVKSSGAKVCVVFEGRDTAGKGGVIKAITERVSPRVFRVVALPAPTEREKSQMYVQRYLPHLPPAERSSSSTEVGTTARGSNGCSASAPRKKRSTSSN